MTTNKTYTDIILDRILLVNTRYKETKSSRELSDIRNLLNKILPDYISYAQTFLDEDFPKINLSKDIFILISKVNLSYIYIHLYIDTKLVGTFKYTYKLSVLSL